MIPNRRLLSNPHSPLDQLNIPCKGLKKILWFPVQVLAGLFLVGLVAFLISMCVGWMIAGKVWR